jgi:tetratricopeptide (TPR) repeat protein
VSESDYVYPRIHFFYQQYMAKEDTAAFIKRVSETYTIATLHRLAEFGEVTLRRASMLAIGFLGGFESNAVLGRGLNDDDRAVRMVAENAIRQVWCRVGSERQRHQLSIIVRLNTSQQFHRALQLVNRLVEEAPHIAEAWNQRAVSRYHLSHFNGSILDCRQSLELNPYHFGAAAGMGQCYLEKKDNLSALECFQRALKLNPSLEGVRAQVSYLQKLMGGEK